MRYLVAIPLEEYSSEGSSDGIVYSIADREGRVYLRSVVVARKYADHDLVIKELAEAPSSVRLETTKFLDSILGESKWEIITRYPFNGSQVFEQNKDLKLNRGSIELVYNPKEDTVVRNYIN